MKKRILISVLVAYSLLAGMLSAQDGLPSREERIYSLALIWREMAYNFVFPEKLQYAHLDSLYRAYLPKVEQAQSGYEYFRVLCAFMAHFNDAHTYVTATNRPDVEPPLKAINFGKKIIVSNIAKSMVDKIPIGSEILKINHIPVAKYITDSVYLYTSASTPDAKFDKAARDMLYGKPQSVVSVTVKTPNGEEDVNIIRGAKEVMVAANAPLSAIDVKIIDGTIGYIRLPTFLPQYIEVIDSVFLSWVPRLKNCKGLIIDVRGNRGGVNRAWMMLAACHTKFIHLQGKWFSRKNIYSYKIAGETDIRYKDYYLGIAMEEIKSTPPVTNIPETLQLHQPLVVLSGQFTASASESFLAVMKETGRATVIGEPSVGATSSPMLVSLPGGFEASIAASKYVNPDGTQPNETGILPDIYVKRGYDAYMQGRDNVLERAIEELRKL
jgi:C-terminal processing protease CtpA/Prc